MCVRACVCVHVQSSQWRQQLAFVALECAILRARLAPFMEYVSVNLALRNGTGSSFCNACVYIGRGFACRNQS